jgi:hypothetical protein
MASITSPYASRVARQTQLAGRRELFGQSNNNL